MVKDRCKCESSKEEVPDVKYDFGIIPVLHTLAFASRVHLYQYDKSGEPYIAHVARVVSRVDSVEEKIVAALHDVVEYSKLTLDDLIKFKIAVDIFEALGAITRKKGESYSNYLFRVKENPLALKVKLADIEDDISPKRKFKPDKDYKSLMRRYKRAKAFLLGEKTKF